MKQEPSPSFHLAFLTFDRLVKAGLLRADRRHALISKMSAGTITSEDWRLEIELTEIKEERQ
jgi:hypothetical protein